MSVPQYIRKASLIVGSDSGEAIDLSALRFAFSIRRGDLQTPNSADIRVYNVSAQTAERIRQILPSPEFTRIVIQAGYEGNYGVIFDGQIKQVRRGRESQLDTYLDITAADGDSAYNFAVSAVSLAAGSTPSDHIAAVLEGMAKFGVSRGYIPKLEGENGLPRGKVIFGMSRDELRKVAKTTSTSWSIQDGKVNFIPLTAYMPGDVPVITAATGMVGLPEQTQDGIKIKCLLNPNLKIGTQVKLDNASIQRYRYNLSINQQAQNAMSEQSNKINDDGFYYVMVADHQGDTRGNAWFTELTCLAVDATVPISYTQRQGVNNSVGPIKRYG
jgi:hypothetical protein